MNRLCFQYLVIHGNKNLPKIIQIVLKGVKNFAKTNKPYYVAKDGEMFAKGVEFRQIWSHWS